MSNLLRQIQLAQRHAGEQVCIEHLRAQGLHFAPDQAPTFTLHAQDEGAEQVVKLWIDLNTPRLGALDPQIQSAHAALQAMRDWSTKKESRLTSHGT